MILVDIYALSVNEQYDFKVDENAYIADVAEEIGQFLFPEEIGKAPVEEDGDFLLCDYESRRILPSYQTLKQNGIGNGSRLVLI